MLEAAKDRHFVAPGLAILDATAQRGRALGHQRRPRPIAIGYELEWEAALESMKKMHRRGIRVLPGGDYGFAWTPQGQNAKDLEFFVKLPRASRRWRRSWRRRSYGGQIMGSGHELGQIREGYLADLLLVDGDPLADVRSSRTGPAAGYHEGRHVPQGAEGGAARAGRSPWRDMTSPGAWIAGAGRRAAGSRRSRPGALADNAKLFLIDAAQRPHARGALLHRGERLHARLRADAQRQSGARLAVPARRLPRLRGQRRARARGSWRWPRGFCVAALVGLALQVADLPPHAGPGPAADAGHDRPVDRAGRPDAVGVGRRRSTSSSRRPGDLRRRTALAAGRSLSRPTGWSCWRFAVVVGSCSGGCSQPHARRHDDPRRRRRPRHAGGDRRQRPVGVRRSFAIGAGLAGFGGVVGGTALSIAPGEDARTCWPRWWSSSSAAWAASSARRSARAHRPGRAVRLAYVPTYGIVFMFLDHGDRAGLPAPGHPGAARSDERRRLAQGDERRGEPRSAWPRRSAGRRDATRPPGDAEPVGRTPAWLAWLARRLHRLTSSPAGRARVYPWLATRSSRSRSAPSRSRSASSRFRCSSWPAMAGWSPSPR